MPRDSSGNCTLTGPNPYPAVTNTVISSSAFNTLFADQVGMFTDSLSRTGLGGMLAAFTLVDGTASAPAFAFTNESNSGLWRAGAGDVEMTVLGSTMTRWTSTNFFQVSLDGGSTWRTPAYRGNVVTSSSSGGFITSATSLTPVTNLAASITTTGGAVRVYVQSDGLGSTSTFGGESVSGNSAGLIIAILRGATVISKSSLSVLSAAPSGLTEIFAPTSSILALDVIGAGTYTYSIQIQAISPTNARLTNAVLVVEEL